ncbi:hypothetical protein H0B43_35405 [Rhodococcus wratislaviensis]|nr:hypothetical protein [Rhodococcus sp. 4CII]
MLALAQRGDLISYIEEHSLMRSRQRPNHCDILGRAAIPSFDSISALRFESCGQQSSEAAKDLEQKGIRIKAIAPSAFDTNIGGPRLSDQPEIAAAFSEDSAVGRLAQPKELNTPANSAGSVETTKGIQSS